MIYSVDQAYKGSQPHTVYDPGLSSIERESARTIEESKTPTALNTLPSPPAKDVQFLGQLDAKIFPDLQGA